MALHVAKARLGPPWPAQVSFECLFKIVDGSDADATFKWLGVVPAENGAPVMLTRTQADQLGRALSLWPYNSTIVTRPRVTVFDRQKTWIVFPTGNHVSVVNWFPDAREPFGFGLAPSFDLADTQRGGLRLVVIPAVTADRSSVFLQLRAEVLGRVTIPFPDAPPGAGLYVERPRAAPIARIDRNIMCKDEMTAVFLLPGNSRYEKSIVTLRPTIIIPDPWLKYRQQAWPQPNTRPTRKR